MTRRSTIQTEYADEIQNAVDRFGDHEDMSVAQVVKWLEQFDDSDITLALDVIAATHYFNAANIRTMAKLLFEMTVEELESQGLGRAAFVAVGGEGGGSNIVVRVIRDLLRGTPHKVLSMLDVAKLEAGTYDAIVFVDDFAGTGESLVDWWESVEPTIRPTNAAVLFGLLVVYEPALDRIGEFAEQVVPVTVLDPIENVLSADNPTFSEDQKAQVLEYCRATGCGPRFLMGFGDSGLLVAFKHVCPNNSLPILWIKTDKWRPLFKRRAI